MSNGAFADIGACLFDAYGTLFDVHSPVGKEAQKLGDKADSVSATWRQKQVQYTWLRSLMGAHADFWQVTGDALDFALAAHDVDDPVLRERLMELYLTLDTYPEVPSALRRLREAGVSCAILSNGEPRMLRSAAESAGIAEVLDDILSIEDVGIYKPDPRVYQLGVDRTGVEARRICFVSSNAWDAAGAAHFGFNVAWINRFGQVSERLPGKPAAEIATLDEIPALLGL
jgi:2-haloacid dehalogenase